MMVIDNINSLSPSPHFNLSHLNNVPQLITGFFPQRENNNNGFVVIKLNRNGKHSISEIFALHTYQSKLISPELFGQYVWMVANLDARNTLQTNLLSMPPLSDVSHILFELRSFSDVVICLCRRSFLLFCFCFN